MARLSYTIQPLWRTNGKLSLPAFRANIKLQPCTQSKQSCEDGNERSWACHMWPLTILLVGPLQITVDKLPSGPLTWKSPGVPSKGKCSSRAPWMGGSSEPMEDTRRGSAAVRKPHVARQPKPGAGSPLRCGLPRPVRHMLTYGCPFLGARYNMMECPLGCHLKPPKLGNPPTKDRPKYTSDARTCKQSTGLGVNLKGASASRLQEHTPWQSWKVDMAAVAARQHPRQAQRPWELLTWKIDMNAHRVYRNTCTYGH